MSDIAFQCAGCSKNLAVGDTYIGVAFPCPGCQAQLIVPSPSFVFPCPLCGNHLFGDPNLPGQIYGCPDCDHMFTVPQMNTIRCPKCGVHLEMEDEDYAGVAGFEVDCPQCAAVVSVPLIPSSMVEEEAPPPDPELIDVPCPGCDAGIRLTPEVYKRDVGKLIRCPKCKRFLRVPARLTEPKAASQPRAAEPPAPMDSANLDIKATMRMDSLLESIPQGRRVQEGHCLYCDLPTRQLDAHTFVCENCRRVFRTLKHRHGNTPRR
jgi:phage FluMu protein Com